MIPIFSAIEESLNHIQIKRIKSNYLLQVVIKKIVINFFKKLLIIYFSAYCNLIFSMTDKIDLFKNKHFKWFL